MSCDWFTSASMLAKRGGRSSGRSVALLEPRVGWIDRRVNKSEVFDCFTNETKCRANTKCRPLDGLPSIAFTCVHCDLCSDCESVDVTWRELLSNKVISGCNRLLANDSIECELSQTQTVLCLFIECESNTNQMLFICMSYVIEMR